MHGLRIVIVDNSALTRTQLKFLLEELPGYFVVGEAQSGLEAVQQSHMLHPDVIILDLEMHGQNSLAALQQIKTNALAPTIVLMSPFPLPAKEQSRCLEAGADALLDKRKCFHELVPLLARLIGEQAILRPEMVRPWDFPVAFNNGPRSV